MEKIDQSAVKELEQFVEQYIERDLPKVDAVETIDNLETVELHYEQITSGSILKRSPENERSILSYALGLVLTWDAIAPAERDRRRLSRRRCRPDLRRNRAGRRNTALEAETVRGGRIAA